MAEDDVVRVEFGSGGKAYFRQQFSEYNFTPLIALAAQRECDIKETFAFLPKAFAGKALAAKNHRWALGMSLKHSPTRPPLIDFIEEYLDANPNHVCVMENADRRKGDAYVRQLECRMYFHGTNVYHISLPGDLTAQIDYELGVSGCLRYFLAILTSPNEFFVEHLEGGVDFSNLESLVQNAAFVISTAWDEEGYMIARLGDSTQR